MLKQEQFFARYLMLTMQTHRCQIRIYKACVVEIFPYIAEAARSGSCELCLKTMDLFTGAYGSEVPAPWIPLVPWGPLMILMVYLRVGF